MLLPGLRASDLSGAVSFGDRSLSYAELRGAASAVATRVEGRARVAVWARPSLEACVGVLGVLTRGAAAVPLNPKLGSKELEHVVSDSAPDAILVAPDDELPRGCEGLERIDVDVRARTDELPPEPDTEDPALIIYTSGTTGPPKGVVLSRRAIASNLDALYDVWEWTANDVLVHALPLFHVHGLVLGVLGPLRCGGRLIHVGRFSPEAVADALSGSGTMLFGVPTMYHRLASAGDEDPTIGRALAGARLLVSGSAALPTADFRRIEELSGQKTVERYGMTETIMNCSVRASGDRRPGYVGPPLPGVSVRLVDDAGVPIDEADDETIGGLEIRGPNLFTEYLNRPDATRDALREGWFVTGDLATRAPDGYVRIVGRRATDLIKVGGFKVGAAEVEWALLDHPSVREAAVTGEADPDLGERIVAWIVPEPTSIPAPEELSDHVAAVLAPHKRPREVRFVDELPRNEMGKVQKARLKSA